jgi:hypothetical protein
MKLSIGLFRDQYRGTNPTQAQWHEAIAAYELHAAKGLTPNQVADEMGVTRATACVLKRLSVEARI